MSQSQPTNATQAKERHYAHLANSLARLSQAVGQTADLFGQMQRDLDSMRTLAGIHASQCGYSEEIVDNLMLMSL